MDVLMTEKAALPVQAIGFDGVARGAIRATQQGRSAARHERCYMTGSGEPQMRASHVFGLDDRRFIPKHPDQVLWRDEGIRKGDLIDYYLEVAPFLMPFIVDRPLSFLRCPDGMLGACEYQKTAPAGFPAWIPTRRLCPEQAVVGCAEHVIGSERAALAYLVNAGGISVHPWSCRVDSLDRPDELLLDLDPTEIAFREVRNAALLVRDLLARFKIRSWVKTSGGRGLHVMVPLAPLHTFDEVRAAADLITRLARSREPGLFTLQMRRARRRGKILIDVQRNRRGATLISPYAVREFSPAPVASPLDWSELTRPIYPEDFHFKNILERLRTQGDPMQDFFRDGQSLVPLLDAARSRSAIRA
jgi:bifunctional non-homologous end joining protein LigD